MKTAGDCPDFAESSQQNGTVPIVFGTGFAPCKKQFTSACDLRLFLIRGRNAVRMAGGACGRTPKEAGTNHRSRRERAEILRSPRAAAGAAARRGLPT